MNKTPRARIERGGGRFAVDYDRVMFSALCSLGLPSEHRAPCGACGDQAAVGSTCRLKIDKANCSG
jgi:hypothetical protein